MKKETIEHWHRLEKIGNVGLDYVINPVLYPRLAEFLFSHPSSTVVDIGAGTNALALDLLCAAQKDVPGLKGIRNLRQVRANVSRFIGFETAIENINRGRLDAKDAGCPNTISMVQFLVKKKARLPLTDATVALAVSRQFLMHLDTRTMDDHLIEISRILLDGGQYILSILNPTYEQGKRRETNPSAAPLIEDKKYEFAHGSKGELGEFTQYWKSLKAYDKLFRHHFTLTKQISCVPITDVFKKTHARYYQHAIPMAYVYVLTK